MNLNIHVSTTSQELGELAAENAAELLNQAISEKGSARLLLATGTSQFDTLSALVKKDVEWDKVEMFHLDEYVGLPETHPASFRGYLRERFVSKVPIKAACFVNGEGDVEKNIEELTEEIRKAPIDVGLIGIGENGHIAFNDPPADFETDAAYKIVTLDERCRRQQVGEGWFADFDSVPKQAITMCPKQILSCAHIITAVPYAVKAEAVYNTITQPVNPNVPATILKTHPDIRFFFDEESASRLLSI